MIRFDLLWWVGWGWFVAWIAAPLLLLPQLGPVLGLLIWAMLMPWSGLVGMAGLHRLLPDADTGTFRMFCDEGSVRWAIKSWAPSTYLTLFQPLFFTSEGFQRLALRAFGARIGPGALVTSRTVLREPHRLRLGARSLIGEYVHLVNAFQPRLKCLVIGDIEIGADVLVGAHSVLAPSVRIGDRCVLEYAVVVGPGCTIGDDARIGAGTTLHARVRVGAGARVGKGCMVLPDTVIPDGAVIPPGAVIAPDPATLAKRT